MKGTRFLAFLLAFVLAFSSIGVADVSAAETLSGNQVTEETLSGNRVDSEDVQAPEEDVVEEQIVTEEVTVKKEATNANAEYSIDLEPSENHWWMYEDEEKVFVINKDNLPEEGNYQMDVQIGYVNEDEGFVKIENQTGLFVYDAEKAEITVFGEELNKHKDELPEIQGNACYWIYISVTDSNEEQLCDYTSPYIDIFPVIENYRFPFAFPESDRCLVGESKWIGNFMWVYYENAEYPYGNEKEVSIKNVEAVEHYTWNDNGEEVVSNLQVFEVRKYNDSWELYGSKNGFTKFKITYETVNGETASHEITLYSLHEYYEVRLNLPEDTNCMHRGETKTVETNVIRRFVNENDDHCEEDVPKDYTVVFDGAEGDREEVAYDSMTFSVDGSCINVQASEENYGYEEVVIRIDGPEDNAYAEWTQLGMEVTDRYFNILPNSMENIKVGDTIDITEFAKLYLYEEGKAPVDVVKAEPNRYRLKLGPYSDIWALISDDETAPVLKRMKADGGEIAVWGQYLNDNGDWEGVKDRNYWFDNLDYSVNMEMDRDWIHKDEVITYEFNTDNLNTETDVNLDVTLEYFVDDVRHQFGEDGYQLIEENGKYKLILDVAKVSADHPGADENGGFYVNYSVTKKVDNEEFVVYKDRKLLWFKSDIEHYAFPNEWISLLLGDNEFINKNLRVYVENKDYPWGRWMDTEITDIEVLRHRQYYEDGAKPTGKSIVFLSKDENGWNFYGEDHGETDFRLFFNDIHGNKESYDFTVTSSGDQIFLQLDKLNNAVLMPPNSRREVAVKAVRRYIDSKNNQHQETLSANNLVFKDGEENQTTLEDRLAYYSLSGNNLLVIETKDYAGGDSWFNIGATVTYRDNNGNIQEQPVDGSYRLGVYENTCYMKFNNPDAIESFVKVGEQLDLSKLMPEVRAQREGEPERTLSAEEVYFVIEDWDSNAWTEVPRENGEENEIILLERTGTWATNLDLVARLRENEEELERYTFEFAGTETWFRHLRGGGHTWVYTDEIGYTIDLDMNNFAGMSDVNVEWIVGELDENNNFIEDRLASGTKIAGADEEEIRSLIESYQYVIDEDTTSIRLNGENLVKDFRTNDNRGVTVRAIIRSGDEVLYQFDTWVEIKDSICRLEGEDGSELLYWEGTGWVYEQNTIDAWVENEHFPYGKNVTLYIEDMALENHDSENPAFTLYSHRASGYWNIYAEQPGGATVTFRLHHGYMGSFEISKDIYASDEMYYFQVFPEKGTNVISKGEYLNLITDFYKYKRDDNGKIVETYIPKNQYEIAIEPDNGNLVKVVSLDTIKGSEFNTGGTNVKVTVTFKRENEDVDTREYPLWIEVSDYIKTLNSETYYVEPNSIHDIDKFNINIVEKYTDENGELVVNTYEPDKVRFEDVGNYNYFWITWWNQKIAVNNKINRSLPLSNKVYVVAEHDGQQFEGWVNVVICEHNYQKKTMSAAGGATTTYDYCAKCQHVKNYKTFYLSKTSYTFTGSVQKPSVVVLDKDGKALDSKYYSVSYPSGCKNAGTYKVTISFKGEYSGSETLSYSIGAKKITPAVTLSKTEFTYNKKVQTPTVTVKDGATKLTANTDYTVSYSSGRKNVGKYTVTVTLKGNYSGTKSVTYTIIPKGTSISSLSAASKAFTVKWKKQATQTTGYQIQYSTSKAFTGAKTVNVKGTSTVSKTVKSLKAKKKYYVRVRTYKTVSGVTYYSSWSGAKSIKTK